MFIIEQNCSAASRTVKGYEPEKRSDRGMVIRPVDFNVYEFIVVCALRAQQLQVGCTPRVAGDHAVTVMAQMEVAARHVVRADATSDAPRQCAWQR